MGRYAICDEAVNHISRPTFSEFMDDVLCQEAFAAGRRTRDPKMLHGCRIALPIFELGPILNPIAGVWGRLSAQGLGVKFV